MNEAKKKQKVDGGRKESGVLCQVCREMRSYVCVHACTRMDVHTVQHNREQGERMRVENGESRRRDSGNETGEFRSVVFCRRKLSERARA